MDLQSRVVEFFKKQDRDRKKDQIEVFVDFRENPVVAELLKEMGAIVTERQLDLGDFIVSDRLIIERKTSSDFESSIIDGRLFEQASRLEEIEFPFLIIEGKRKAERIKQNAFIGATMSLIVEYGIRVLFSEDKKETAQLIFSLARREQLKEKRPLRLISKKKAFSFEQQQLIIIEAFPSIGPKMAKKILEEFKTIDRFFCADIKKLEKVVGKAKAAKIKSILQGRSR